MTDTLEQTVALVTGATSGIDEMVTSASPHRSAAAGRQPRPIALNQVLILPTELG